MGSFAQISLGVLILAAAFIFGQFVNQQKSIPDSENVASLPSTDETAWQSQGSDSLFEFEAPSVPDNFQAFPENAQRPALPFSRTEPQDANATAQQFNTMPNHAPRDFETTIKPNSSMPIAPEMLALPSDPEADHSAMRNRSESVPLVEPDFSGMTSGGNAPELNYLPGEFFSNRGPQRDDMLSLQSQNNGSSGNALPAAPEFTIYPDADRPSGSDFQQNLNSEESRLVAGRGQGIAPIGAPLTQPTAPSPPGNSIASRGSTIGSDAGSGGQFVPSTSGNDANGSSWIDDFNEPFVTREPPVLQEPSPVVSGPESAVTNDAQGQRGAVSIVERPVIPEPDESTSPRVADSSMLPFGLNEQAKSRLVEVQTRSSEMTLSTSEFVSRTTKRGDTLQKLATEYYGSPGFYLDIYLANQDQLRNPAEVPIGITLRIPVYEP